MERKIEWMTSKGKAAVTVRLVTSRTINADGDMVTVPCCDLQISAEAPCFCIGDLTRKEQMVGNVKIAANIGKLAIRPEHLTQIDAAIAEIKSTPEWQAKEAKEAAAKASVNNDAEMKRKMGICPKCGTVCYGDCEA